MSMLGDVCAVLGDAARAATLYDLLLSHANQLIVVANLVACYGVVDHYLALLAGTCGRHEAAEAHFCSALALEERIQAPPLIARTQTWFARTLIARNRPGDQERARELLDDAMATAQDLGMVALVAQAAPLLASIARG